MRDESFSGRRYHGPSAEAGLTAEEYRETMDEYQDDRDRMESADVEGYAFDASASDDCDDDDDSAF